MAEQCSIKSETDAQKAIEAIAAWLDTEPHVERDRVLRDWARTLLHERVDDMSGCPLCQG